jgi:archaellum component FlaC
LLNKADLLIQSSRLETQLHELCGMQQEWREEKVRVSEIRETMNRGTKVIIHSAVERDEYIDKGMDKFQERLNRHQVEIDKSYRQEKELRERVEVLEAQVESMSERVFPTTRIWRTFLSPVA